MPYEVSNIDNLKILLVEDSETDAYAISRVLQHHMEFPCELKHVESMAEAETLLQQNKDAIDLILLDLGLPDTQGGNDTFQRLENVKEHVPVIVLTSVHDHDLAIGMVDDGAEDYVRKSSVTADPDIL